MRPYLETKVVKVKKSEIKPKPKILILRKKIKGDYKYKKVNSNSKLFFYRCGFSYRINDEVYCYDDKEIWRIYKIIEPKKDNWVNGENLDKIKFPCFCSYSDNRHGLITKTYIGEDKETIYTLHGIENQYFSLSSIKSYDSLEKLIKAFGIHILKGKIIIYEEE